MLSKNSRKKHKILGLKSRFDSILVPFISLHITRVNADLFVVLLQGSHVFPGLGELSLLHTFSHVPVDKGSLGVHQVELVVEPGPGLGNGGGVRQHADSPLYLGQVPTRNDGGWLVVDANLEPCWAPVYKLYRPLALDGCDSSIHVFGHHVTPVEET